MEEKRPKIIVFVIVTQHIYTVNYYPVQNHSYADILNCMPDGKHFNYIEIILAYHFSYDDELFIIK